MLPTAPSKPITYLALGDSMSIDKYTGVEGGGAASQFAALLGAANFINLTFDGCTTAGVLAKLDQLPAISPDIITLTAGGNDLLEYAFGFKRTGEPIPSLSVDKALAALLASYGSIADRLAEFNCKVIINTIYDPTDGSDSLAEEMGVPHIWRTAFDKINAAIRETASRQNFRLSDLEPLFRGHHTSANDPWTVLQIEPNLPGATAIAKEWHRIYQDSPSNTNQ